MENFNIIFSIMIIFLFFICSYLFFSYPGIPIGWDTPRYIGLINKISNGALVNYLVDSGGYNIVYPIFASIFTLFINSFYIEIYLPILICIGVVIFGSYSQIIPKKYNFYLILAFSIWFAIYRLGSDLHSNLLCLIILLISTNYFIKFKINHHLSYNNILFMILIFIASFTHIETTIYFAGLFIITLITESYLSIYKFNLNNLFKNIIIIILASGFGLILYVKHLSELTSFSMGNIVVNEAIDPLKFLGVLTIVFPLSIIGLKILYDKIFIDKEYYRGYLFLFIWAITSLILGISQYFVSSLQIFSERALILFPTPFLLAICAYFINSQKIFSIKQRLRLYIIVSFIAVTVFVTTAPLYDRSFITPQFYDKLQWIKSNYNGEKVVILFNDIDAYAGVQANLNDDWVQAVLGNHYSYLGLPDYLLNGLETPFMNIKSFQESKIFFEKLNSSEVLIKNKSDYQYFLISDVYYPYPLPVYYEANFINVHEGVYICNDSISINEFKVPFSTFIENNDLFYSLKDDWTMSTFSLNYYQTYPSSIVSKECLFTVPHIGNYHFSIRYFDGGGSDIRILIDSETVATIVYSETNSPKIISFNKNLTTDGTHTITVESTIQTGRVQYVSLDYFAYDLS